MTTKFAFAGFRHPHIRDMFERCKTREDVEIVACCEEDATTRDQLAEEGVVSITHDNFDVVLSDCDCDVVAIGDVYARRGALAAKALQAGKHVMSDKPMCISLQELDAIESIATEKGLIVGMMLDMRDLPVFLGIRQLLQDGAIGELRAMSFDGQHPLLRGKRPEWYFEPGMHGGTLNDIAVHAIDMIPWATGLEIGDIVGARCWNARTQDTPDFRECAQALFTLSNGAGVMCDVSYMTPDSIAYQFPYYWRFCLWGDGGTIVASLNDQSIELYRDGAKEVELVELPEGKPGAYLDAFLGELQGQTDLHLTSADAIRATRTCLELQQVADAASS